MNEVIQVQITTPHREQASVIARHLVERRLAACVQISGPITSVYRWQGTIETAEEWACTIKTIEPLFPQVERQVRDLHLYDEPEIIATRIGPASSSYLRWLNDQVADVADFHENS